MDDPELNQEQLDLIARLSPDQLDKIDALLISNCSDRWQKVSKIVGVTMIEDTDRIKGIPDIFYAQRISQFVDNGILIADGSLTQMRNCEVKFS